MGSRVTGKWCGSPTSAPSSSWSGRGWAPAHLADGPSSIATPGEVVNVGDELTLLVIRVDPHERRIGLSLKELAHAVAPPPEAPDDRGGGGRKGKRGKSREYDYDDEE